MHDQLVSKLNAKSAVSGIVGLGYVGLPLIIRFSEVGYRVVGFDINQEKVDTLQRGKSLIEHIPHAAIQKALDEGFEATTDLTCVG